MKITLSLFISLFYLGIISRPSMAKHLSDWCYDSFEAECMSKRNVDDVVPCLRGSFQTLPKICNPYKKLILQSLRRLDPVDTKEIQRCEKLILKGCFVSRSLKKILSCMQSNLKEFPPTCLELKIKISGDIAHFFKDNSRIKRYTLGCSKELTKKCSDEASDYPKHRHCIKTKLSANCKELFYVEDYRIKKVYNTIEIANMHYQCDYEKSTLCPKTRNSDEQSIEKCLSNSLSRLSRECQDFYREVNP